MVMISINYLNNIYFVIKSIYTQSKLYETKTMLRQKNKSINSNINKINKRNFY